MREGGALLRPCSASCCASRPAGARKRRAWAGVHPTTQPSAVSENTDFCGMHFFLNPLCPETAFSHTSYPVFTHTGSGVGSLCREAHNVTIRAGECDFGLDVPDKPQITFIFPIIELPPEQATSGVRCIAEYYTGTGKTLAYALCEIHEGFPDLQVCDSAWSCRGAVLMQRSG